MRMNDPFMGPAEDPEQCLGPTFHALKRSVDVDGAVPIKEAHDALKLGSFGEPQLCLHPQPAADLVVASIAQGSAVGRHAVGDLDAVDLPGQVDVVGVEASGQTDQRLLPFAALLVLALSR